MKLRTFGPYFLLFAAAVPLALLSDRFPSPMPVHWGIDGRPNGYFPKTPLAMAFPLLLMGGILIFLDAIHASGSRIGPPQNTEGVRRLLAPIRWLLALMAFPLAFAPLWGPTPVMVVAGAMLLVVFVQILRAPRIAPSGGDGWHGIVYSNAADPRLLVPKRYGLGWTFNFAKPMAWLLLAVLVLGPLGFVAVMLLRAATHH